MTIGCLVDENAMPNFQSKQSPQFMSVIAFAALVFLNKLAQ
jgi:hypothetical protein